MKHDESAPIEEDENDEKCEEKDEGGHQGGLDDKNPNEPQGNQGDQGGLDEKNSNEPQSGGDQGEDDQGGDPGEDDQGGDQGEDDIETKGSETEGSETEGSETEKLEIAEHMLDVKYDKDDMEDDKEGSETEGSRENQFVELMDVKTEVSSPGENVPTNCKILKTIEFAIILY